MGRFGDVYEPMVENVANKYRENGYRFVPLVREGFSTSCSIDVLLLRTDYPGSIFTAGDVDNRIKTLVDALTKPVNADALRGNKIPADGEDPFFCLLENDKLITGFRVETDTLLTGLDATEEERGKVEMVISVEIRPYDITNQSLGFA